MNKKVVIIGDEHYNTLGVIRSLGEAGVRPDIIIIDSCKAKSWVLTSCYVKHGTIVERNNEKIIAVLLDKSNGQNERIYLVPTSDFAVKLIDDNFNVLREHYVLPSIGNKAGELTRLMNKRVMAQYAEDAGFLIPKTKSHFVLPDFKNDKELFESINVLYPVIVKQENAFAAKDKIWIVKNKIELKSALSKCINEKVIIQQFIEKDEEIGIQGVGFGSSAEPVVPGVVHKIRTSLNAIGSTTYADLRSIAQNDPVQQVKNFIKNIGYYGIFDIEVLRKGESYYFIECNFRNGAYGYSYTRMGANLPMIWMGENVGVNTFNYTSLKLINTFSDYKHIKNGNISWYKWMWQLATANVYLTANCKDPKPFFYRLIMR
ncbi:MAG TPA: ATP-grasp domain-containing protein [Clostridiales bacterium]|nr:ATP-grasp domain-containing protein [Clostridiales bacterium]